MAYKLNQVKRTDNIQVVVRVEPRATHACARTDQRPAGLGDESEIWTPKQERLVVFPFGFSQMELASAAAAYAHMRETLMSFHGGS